MKNLIPSLAFAVLVSSPLAGLAQDSLETDPGYLPIDKAIDLKTIRPEVNVNLPRFLLKDAASTLNGGKDDPFAGTGINFAELVKDIKLIRVLVIEAGKTNRAALDKSIKVLRTELEGKWTSIVSVPEENVGVYMRSSDDGESMAGLAVLVYDGGDAVIGNVVGQVSIGKVLKIASRLDKFPKDLLKKITLPPSASDEKSDPGADKGQPAAEKGQPAADKGSQPAAEKSQAAEK
jgi:hypothetical protein